MGSSAQNVRAYNNNFFLRLIPRNSRATKANSGRTSQEEEYKRKLPRASVHIIMVIHYMIESFKFRIVLVEDDHDWIFQNKRLLMTCLKMIKVESFKIRIF